MVPSLGAWKNLEGEGIGGDHEAMWPRPVEVCFSLGWCINREGAIKSTTKDDSALMRSAQTTEREVRKKAELSCRCVPLSILSRTSSPCRVPHYEYLSCSGFPKHCGGCNPAAFSRHWPHTLDLPKTVFLNL